MPIKPENKAKYGPDWRMLSWAIRYFRASGQCEWIDPASGERCQRRDGEPIPGNEQRKTVLTVAHLNHDESDCRLENLLAMCQSHHLRYDARIHTQHAAETRRKKEQSLYPGVLFG